MKKMMSVFILIALIGIPSFAQEDESWHRYAVTFDPLPLILGTMLGGFGIGASFEFLPVSMVSARARVNYLGVKISRYTVDEDIAWSHLDIAGEGRFYPFKTGLGGLFLGAGLAYMRIGGSATFSLEDESESTRESINALSIFGNVGYKLIIGNKITKPGSLFVELAVVYRHYLFPDIDWEDYWALDTYFWAVGLKNGAGYALTMGVAF
jgi:hypothetical protein